MLLAPIGALVLMVNPSPASIAPDVRAQASREIASMLKDDAATIESMRQTSQELSKRLAGSRASERLANLPEDRDAARKELLDLQLDLAFSPLMEAKLPEGFPGPTPVGEVELKEFPVYRMAVAREDAGKQPAGGFFWHLFGHITKNQIPMTAPVEMTLERPDDADAMRMTMMGFMYEHAEQGTLGPDGNIVEVIEVPAGLAVSVGMRGAGSGAQLREAQSIIEQWLSSNVAYEAAGPMRMFGYNSPSVPNARRYFEVQLPVRKRAAE